MKLNKKMAILVSLFIFSCSKDDVIQPADLYTYWEDEHSIVNFSGENIISSNNAIGGIYVNGQVLNDSIRVYTNKRIVAESRELAENHFSDINFDFYTKEDTLFTSIELDSHRDIEEYSCGLFLTIPYEKELNVLYANGKVSVSDLNNKIRIVDSIDDIEIIRHFGSCEISTSNGDIEIEMAIPDGGYCQSITKSGNITLRIPVNSSTEITAYSHSGKVEYSNLVINNLVQKSDSLSGTLENGNGIIFLETKNGDIQITGIN